mgnify:CR=1 FL=1
MSGAATGGHRILPVIKWTRKGRARADGVFGLVGGDHRVDEFGGQLGVADQLAAPLGSPEHRVGIGVDGSASNDASHLIDETRTALLLQRVDRGAGAFSVQEALELATRGSASVLGRDDIGVLAAGKAADLIGVRLDTLSLAGGAVHDPLAALLLCRVEQVDLSVINGRVVVRDGELTTLDVAAHVARHNAIAQEIVGRHPQPERFKLV